MQINVSERSLQEVVKSQDLAIIVRPAVPQDAPMNWAVSNETTQGLPLNIAGSTHLDPQQEFAANSNTGWTGLVKNQNHDLAVLDAFIEDDPDEIPIGTVTALVHQGERQLSNAYVAKRAQQMGVFSELLEAARVWHGGEAFKSRIPTANFAAQAAFKKLGFIPKEGIQLPNSHVGICVPHIEMEYTGA